jgi:hypothetical protein
MHHLGLATPNDEIIIIIIKRKKNHMKVNFLLDYYDEIIFQISIPHDYYVPQHHTHQKMINFKAFLENPLLCIMPPLPQKKNT